MYSVYSPPRLSRAVARNCKVLYVCMIREPESAISRDAVATTIAASSSGQQMPWREEKTHENARHYTMSCDVRTSTVMRTPFTAS